MSQPILIALLALLWLGVLVWHLQENKALRHELTRSRMPIRLERRMLRLAWGRSFQLLMVLGFTLGIFGIFQWRIGDMREGYRTQIAALEARNSSLAEQQARHAEAAPVALAPLGTETVGTVFNPETSSPFDALKKRYEELYVSYLFLTRCGLTGYDGYQVLSGALAREAASINAPATLNSEVIDAARGTYQEMYLKTPCNTAQARQTAAGFNAYLAQVRRQGSVPAVALDAAKTAPVQATETPAPGALEPPAEAAPLPQENGGIPPVGTEEPPPEAAQPPTQNNPVGAPVTLSR